MSGGVEHNLTKHVEGKKRLEAREKDNAEALKCYNTANHIRGETLPKNQQVFRVKVITCFLRAGVLPSKLACFRELLEESAFHVSDQKYMSDLNAQEEQALIKEESEGKCVSEVFDGTTQMGEALAVVLASSPGPAQKIGKGGPGSTSMYFHSLM